MSEGGDIEPRAPRETVVLYGHAEAESVNVSLVKAAPDLSKDALYLRENRPNNLLRWDLDVAPNKNGENATPITYEFRMELDRQMAITGFQSR